MPTFSNKEKDRDKMNIILLCSIDIREEKEKLKEIFNLVFWINGDTYKAEEMLTKGEERFILRK